MQRFARFLPFFAARGATPVALCLSALLAASPPAAAEGYAEGVKARVLLRADTTALGQAIRFPGVGNAEVTAVEVEIPPGGETGWHAHAFPGYAYVLEGELTLESADGKRAFLKAGDAVFESVGLAHNGRNAGKTRVRLVAFFTGEKGRPFSEKAPPPGGR